MDKKLDVGMISNEVAILRHKSEVSTQSYKKTLHIE